MPVVPIKAVVFFFKEKGETTVRVRGGMYCTF